MRRRRSFVICAFGDNAHGKWTHLSNNLGKINPRSTQHESFEIPPFGVLQKSETLVTCEE